MEVIMKIVFSNGQEIKTDNKVVIYYRSSVKTEYGTVYYMKYNKNNNIDTLYLNENEIVFITIFKS